MDVIKAAGHLLLLLTAVSVPLGALQVPPTSHDLTPLSYFLNCGIVATTFAAGRPLGDVNPLHDIM